MNNAILITSIILVALVIIVLVVLVFFRKSNTVATSPYEGTCPIVLDELVYVNNSCCTGTDQRIVTTNGLTFVVGRSSRFYKDVCSTFCSSINPITGFCDTYLDENSYNTCIGLLFPQDCKGNALPIATDGLVPYYAQYAGSQVDLACPTQTTCTGVL